MRAYINNTFACGMLHTMVMSVEGKLDSLLFNQHKYFGPPLPESKKEMIKWTTRTFRQLPPTLAQWQPPLWIERCGTGFLLNDQTACFQRGYCPAEIFKSILSVYAQGFDHTLDEVTRILKDDVHDFVIAIRNRITHEVAASCLVEVRCSSAHADDIPYLYIYELTTNKKFGRHGLAQQLVHAVDALAFLIKSDTCGIWYHTLKGKRLFMGLTVDRTQEQPITDSIVGLYSRCGLRRRTTATPQMDYDSFTSFSYHSWCIDKNTAHYIAMWKEVNLPVIYSDGAVNIMKDVNDSSNNAPLFYHEFPIDKMDAIKRHGIVHPAHKCLHSENDDDLYVATGSTITFTRCFPSTPGHHFFTVWAECAADSFNTHTSIPYWYANSIDKDPSILWTKLNPHTVQHSRVF